MTNAAKSTLDVTRPEASFYRWRALTKEQRRVATAVQTWIDAFCATPMSKDAPGRSIFDWNKVEDTRASNVIIIDGPRGVGKTSLLLTLIEVWRRTLAQENVDDVFGAVAAAAGEVDLLTAEELAARPPATAPTASTPAADASPGAPASATSSPSTPNPPVPPIDPASVAAYRRPFDALRTRIIPIRVLDFAPLPRSTSLITWVAAQLREFIDLLDDRGGTHRSSAGSTSMLPWEPDWDKELPSRKAWADLASSAAWGWDDNIQFRKGSLDPDAYAEELQQSERARVGIVERWRALIRTIVQDASNRYRDRIGDNARIVVPIDDVDMNPSRVVELLEFVRTFWDPQLIFLLSGDSDLLRAALSRYHASALGSNAAKEQSGIDENSTTMLQTHEMAAQTYDKVVPLGQRFRLEDLSAQERICLLQSALKDRPLQSQSASATSQMSKPSDLVSLLKLDPWAATALPSTLRDIHDARQTFGATAKVIDIVKNLWSDSQAREPVTKQELRRDIDKRVTLGRQGVPSVEGDVEPVVDRLGEFRVDQVQSSSGELRKRTHLVLEVASGLEAKGLSQRVNGAFLLAADLAADDPDAAWSAISIADAGYRFPAVRARTRISLGPSPDEDLAEALLKRGVRWPPPEWPAPMDYAMFAADWPEKISHLLVDRDKSDRDVMLVCRFLEQVRYVQWEREQDNPQIAPRTGETSIENITGKLIEDAGKAPTTPRGEAYFDWCTSRVWLIATPESGLPSATAARVLEALPPFGDEVKKFFTEHRDDMRRARFERARANLKAIPQDESEAKITDANVHAVLKIIDTVLGPNHPWVSRFDVWDPSHLERSRPATEAGVVGPPLTTPASPARRRARRP